uniref:Replisome organizer protein n=1 Tax=Dulem virus 42 TaxID=3145760 RepID=A0AAU8BAG0_9CAUD
MIVEVNTNLLDIPVDINMNQLVFLSMVLDKNQKSNQDVRKLISLISDDEISYLVNQGLITSIERRGSIVYEPTEMLLDSTVPKKEFFDLFYDMYPVYVLRPDGSKSYLRANIHKCRHLYNTYIGKSAAMAQHINDCLRFEIEKKTATGKIGYMKTMWRWLVDHQWEETEEEMKDTVTKTQDAYGTELI